MLNGGHIFNPHNIRGSYEEDKKEESHNYTKYE